MGLAIFEERLHDGTCYLVRDIKTQKVIRRLWIQKGVRQGSVEGPALFLAVYEFVVRDIQKARDFAGYDLISVRFDPTLTKRREHGALLSTDLDLVSLDASQLEFVDDLVSFLEVADFG
eukprot:9476817-Pyramimonas_sp.AAC.1